MNMDTEKGIVESVRRDMLINLDSLITAATSLKADLETAQKNNDFSEKAQTFGVAYGGMSGSIMALIQNEAKYNTLLGQIIKAKFLNEK